MAETYNPWTVVNLVFHHLAAEGLHPALGSSDPATPAAALLQTFGIEPAAADNRRVTLAVQQQLADLRATMLAEEP